MLKTCLAILTLLGIGSLLGLLGLAYFLTADDAPATDTSDLTPLTLEIGTTVFDTLTADETITWALAGQGGDCLTLDLISITNGFDPQLRILSSKGAVLTEDDDSGLWVNARIAEFILPIDDLYLIEVSGYFTVANLASAEYELNLQAC